MNNCILKSTESTKVTENNKIDIELTDDELNVSPFEKIVNAKIVKIDAKTLIQIYLCSTCNTQVTINNAVRWCGICENAELQNGCKRARLFLACLIDLHLIVLVKKINNRLL